MRQGTEGIRHRDTENVFLPQRHGDTEKKFVFSVTRWLCGKKIPSSLCLRASVARGSVPLKLEQDVEVLERAAGVEEDH